MMEAMNFCIDLKQLNAKKRKMLVSLQRTVSFSPFQECIQSLDMKFPGSLRVKRLKGMYYEADAKYVLVP